MIIVLLLLLLQLSVILAVMWQIHKYNEEIARLEAEDKIIKAELVQTKERLRRAIRDDQFAKFIERRTDTTVVKLND